MAWLPSWRQTHQACISHRQPHPSPTTTHVDHASPVPKTRTAPGSAKHGRTHTGHSATDIATIFMMPPPHIHNDRNDSWIAPDTRSPCCLSLDNEHLETPRFEREPWPPSEHILSSVRPMTLPHAIALQCLGPGESGEATSPPSGDPIWLRERSHEGSTFGHDWRSLGKTRLRIACHDFCSILGRFGCGSGTPSLSAHESVSLKSTTTLDSHLSMTLCLPMPHEWLVFWWYHSRCVRTILAQGAMLISCTSFQVYRMFGKIGARTNA